MKLSSLLAAASLSGGLLFLGASSYAAYESPSSSEFGLPYSVEFKTLLEHWYNNKSYIGGQVIALRGKSKTYNGNYVDIGSLAGVKKGDVFAVYAPKGNNGDPVGFMKIIEVQQYTSSFEFLETPAIAASERLEVKKVPHQLDGKIPDIIKYWTGTLKAKSRTMASAST